MSALYRSENHGSENGSNECGHIAGRWPNQGHGLGSL